MNSNLSNLEKYLYNAVSTCNSADKAFSKYILWCFAPRQIQKNANNRLSRILLQKKVGAIGNIINERLYNYIMLHQFR